MKDPFHVIPAQGKRRPLILSVPHCGLEFPPEVAAQIKARFVANPEDTDWGVHELYDFAPSMGITLIHARYSRYVIDLNRDPALMPLYADGRKETALVPVTTFQGATLYDGPVPDTEEIARRRAAYFDPYHNRLAALVQETRAERGTVLLYDAHSIRRLVPTIRPTPFPDLILGDGCGKTTHMRLREAALGALRETGVYQVSLNDPFQGGYITRNFGRPAAGVHALQLEMSQDIYLNEDGKKAPEKTARLKSVLRLTLERLADAVETLV